MIKIRVTIDLEGTRGDEAWAGVAPFVEISGSTYLGERGGDCCHAADQPHLAGEKGEAVVEVESEVLAMYAVAHYQRQPRVIDATPVS